MLVYLRIYPVGTSKELRIWDFDVNRRRMLTEAWFRQGAFVGWDEDQVLVFTGPWRPTIGLNSRVLVQDFFLSTKKALAPSEMPQLVPRARFLQELLEYSRGAAYATTWTGPDLTQFAEDFRNVQGQIQREEIEKAVPITCVTGSGAPTDRERAGLMVSLFQKSTSAQTPYGWWAEGEGLLGSTPEVLFDRNDQRIHTMALAGTVAVDAHFSPDRFLNNSKEFREHVLVIEDLVQQLNRLGPVHKSPTEVVQLTGLAHLKTPLTALLSQRVESEDLVRLLHPTPALGVFPRSVGVRWMQDLHHQKQRGLFGAPLVFDFEQRSLGLVCIRSFFWKAEQVFLYAGCGVIRQSQMELEQRELLHKLRSIFRLLGLEEPEWSR